MPIAMKLESPPTPLGQRQHASDPHSARERTKVARDFALLLGAALTIGLTAGLGMVLAVLVLS